MADYTGQYNTPLSEGEMALYEAWLKTLPEYQQNTRDYDLQGFAKSVDFVPLDEEGHMPDTYKKPNHPTFSAQSIYNGADGHYGGTWVNMGGDYFFPSEWNKQFLDGYDDPTATIVR